MKLRTFLASVVMLFFQANAFSGAGAVHAERQGVAVAASGRWQVANTGVSRVRRADTTGVGAAPPTPVMVISYWGYVALPLAMIVAFMVNGWLIPRRE